MNLTKINKRRIKTSRRDWPKASLLIPALVALCLLILAGCSQKQYSVPIVKSGPCIIPEYDAKVWGDYPAYVADLTTLVVQCNKRWAETQKLNERNHG